MREKEKDVEESYYTEEELPVVLKKGLKQGSRNLRDTTVRM